MAIVRHKQPPLCPLMMVTRMDQVADIRQGREL